MAKHKTGYVIGVIFCLGLSLTALLSLAAPAPNIGAAQSPTQTPDPEVINALSQLIRDETCQLPCWWGWILGEDDFQTTKYRLETFTNTAVNDITLENETHFSAQIITNPYFVPDDVYDTFMGFIVNSDNVLSEIFFMVYFPDASDVDWTPYKLPNILRSYGIPDEVKTSFAVDLATGYYLTLKYSTLHLSIRYRVILPNLDHAPLPNDTFLICNTFDPNILEISILLDESKTSHYFATVNDPDFVDFTGIDNMTFSDIFSVDNACIETLPRDQWTED